MQNIYKLYSNIGIINFPNGTYENNDGVYYGSDELFSILDKYINKYTNKFEYRFTNAEDLRFISQSDIYKIIGTESNKLINMILDNSKNDETNIFLGGDNSITFSTLCADLIRYSKKKIGVISFDTHLDINNMLSSPSGNFHGMYFRPFFDKFENSDIEKLVPRKLYKEDICYIGEFDIDEGELEFSNDILKIYPTIIDANKHIIDETLFANLYKFELFINKFEHLHINFDVDVLNSSIFKATGINNPNGIFLDELSNYFKILKTFSGTKTIDIVEVNPARGLDIEYKNILEQIFILLCS